ncbi:radical SAM family heme chaperone HemW [Nesterenkonia alkaliphila]|uniref:Heme chaperone HemW n=1 Tax=Nesterenkonia alkaliphila TaxID=1463631 RepID=A0A7K1UM11_9MICC|nr:radical SAM family heme chaperone HemW [Nesterenkonia alkaliphila]MVT27493.1 coproporphyrinogen III oxidase [Nesterenkonia alkaliphila]GFZ89280.1 coproporphyrinogen III oxidase [Nesterenkonia alkaliphila]
MPSVLPLGDPVPADGSFPPEVLSALASRADKPLGLYVHIPFCSVRCGYCDFNTYTSQDLGPGASHQSYPDTLISELEFARRAYDDAAAPPRALSTVFFGGGTPTLLPAPELARILDAARKLFGFVPGAEITTEANPDTVTAESAQLLAEAGFTRVSLGMQSAVPQVLATLDRTHNPDNVPAAHQAARAAGLETSLDLIYGTPGESLADWERSLEAAIALEPDHISAYSLIIEEGTAMAAQIRRGALADIDPDDQADKYLLAEQLLSRAGYHWYEVSNFSRTPKTRSQHNLNYWLDADWWGAGPGAHSHLAGVRWWNVKHPAAYAQRLHQGLSPGHGREILDAQAKVLEHLMLRLRIREGLDLAEYNALPELAAGGAAPITPQLVAELVREGLLDPGSAEPSSSFPEGRAVLTLQGRLLADAVTHRLLS